MRDVSNVVEKIKKFMIDVSNVVEKIKTFYERRFKCCRENQNIL